jgi:hypothetical protein
MASKNWKALIADNILELAMVFIGVYAAFYLNGVQLRQEQRQRHRQFIIYLEKEAANKAKGDHDTARSLEQKRTDVVAKIDEGAMPDLEPIDFTPLYDRADFASLLQAGGLDVLELRTVARMREVDSISRIGYATMANYQELTNQLIVLHAGEGRDYFYDPATKQLRRQFAVYLESLRAGAEFWRQLSQADDRLLAELANERERFTQESD